MTLQAGFRLGAYEIREAIGSGGMSEVYRARDLRLDRDVAIKILPPRVGSEPAALARFEDEAKVLATLSHPNLLSIFDFGRENGVAYAVTELLEGQTLRSRLARSPLPWRNAVDIGAAVADGLAAAHARGIVHRDLKPENLFLTTDGRVKILDFGIARRAANTVPGSGKAEGDTVTHVDGARPEAVEGTAGYMAPEQIGGLPADARSDVFALGAVLYEMIAGRRAFPGSGTDAISAVIRTDPPPISPISAPLAVERVIRRCLEKSPGARFGSARDLAFALRSAAERAAPRRTARTAAWIAAAAAAAAVVFGAFRFARRRADGPFDSLAVLPLANAGLDPASDYLADGLTDSLIDRLSRLPHLRVVSRASVYAYGRDRPSPPRIGHDLDVRAVLTGSVTRSGNTLTIAVELADARDGRHVWGERYVRPIADLATLEPEIAREIVEALRFRLTGPDETRLAKRFTTDPEAYQLYLKGRYFWQRFTPDDLVRARKYFEEAIAKDPSYALAYSGLSDADAAMGHALAGGIERPDVAFPKARAAALEALRIDPDLAEAHVSLEGVLGCYDGKYTEAERELLRAIALDPNSLLAHRRYARLLDSLRRFDQAIAEIRRAQAVNPLSGFDDLIAAGIFADAGRLDDGMREAHRAAELNSDSAHSTIGLLLLLERRYPEAIAEYRKEAANRGDANARAELAFACAAAGNRGEAQATLFALESLAQQRYVPAYDLALVCAGLGENARALDWLDKAVESHETIESINSDPRFQTLRGDPRFAGILGRLGLDRAAGA